VSDLSNLSPREEQMHEAWWFAIRRDVGWVHETVLNMDTDQLHEFLAASQLAVAEATEVVKMNAALRNMIDEAPEEEGWAP
jgi:hypothetical protein